MIISLLDPEFFNPSSKAIENDIYWSELAEIINLNNFYIGPTSYYDISLKADLLYSTRNSKDPAIGHIFSILNQHSLPPRDSTNSISVKEYRPFLGDPENASSLQNDINQIEGKINLLTKSKCWPDSYQPSNFKLYNFSDELEILRWKRESILFQDNYFLSISNSLDELFPNIKFLDSVFQNAENLHSEISLEQRNYHRILIHHLSILNDYGIEIMRSDKQTRIELFKSYRVEASGNSPNERKDSNLTKKRTFNFGKGLEKVVCEWHTKINSYKGGRIYFAFKNGKILIGSICSHL